MSVDVFRSEYKDGSWFDPSTRSQTSTKQYFIIYTALLNFSQKGNNLYSHLSYILHTHSMYFKVTLSCIMSVIDDELVSLKDHDSLQCMTSYFIGIITASQLKLQNM